MLLGGKGLNTNVLEQTECSEMLGFKLQMPGNNPKENK
jgi:hypothetical protein